jgi:hypothetical protein
VTEPRPLNPAVPAEAAQIVGNAFARLNMAGLTGADVGLTFQAIATLQRAVAPTATPDPATPGNPRRKP